MAVAVQIDLSSFLSEQLESPPREEPNSPEHWVEDLGDGEGIKAAAYLRVSSSRQAKEGLSLEDQEARLRELARKIGVSRIHWFVDAGISGRDFDRRKLNSILDLAEKREIQKLLVAYVDRLGRDSRKLVEFFWDLSDYGVTIQTPEEEIDVKKLEGWLISAIKAWSAQDVNEQRGKSALAGRVRSFTKKRWNRPAPLGYRRREDGWIEKEPGWDPLIKRVYELYLKNANYNATADTVNREFQALLQKPLTHQQIRQIVCDPVCVGKPQFAGKATVEDPNLAYIGAETFRMVQEISGRIRRKRSRKKKDALQDLVKECGIGVLEFIPNIVVLCPVCQGTTVKNGTIYMNGRTVHNYLCRKCGKQHKIPTQRQMKRVQDWIQASLDEEKGLNTKKVNRDLGI
jgi:DNA invertase Pin-like site-specific DNA recombinase